MLLNLFYLIKLSYRLWLLKSQKKQKNACSVRQTSIPPSGQQNLRFKFANVFPIDERAREDPGNQEEYRPQPVTLACLFHCHRVASLRPSPSSRLTEQERLPNKFILKLKAYIQSYLQIDRRTRRVRRVTDVILIRDAEKGRRRVSCDETSKVA